MTSGTNDRSPTPIMVWGFCVSAGKNMVPVTIYGALVLITTTTTRRVV